MFIHLIKKRKTTYLLDRVRYVVTLVKSTRRQCSLRPRRPLPRDTKEKVLHALTTLVASSKDEEAARNEEGSSCVLRTSRGGPQQTSIPKCHAGLKRQDGFRLQEPTTRDPPSRGGGSVGAIKFCCTVGEMTVEFT